MKFYKILVIALGLAILSGCGGSDRIKSPVDDNKEIITSVKVASNGQLDFVGADEFEGFSIKANNIDLAGKTIYIKKLEPEYVKGGYTAVSSQYSVSFSEKDGDVPSAIFPANVTFPFNKEKSANPTFLAIINGNVVPQSSTVANSNNISSNTNIPFAYYAGFKNLSPEPIKQKMIKTLTKTYRQAILEGKVFIDPAGDETPDWSRGFSGIQPGETVYLDVDEGAFGQNIVSVTWKLKRPQSANQEILPNNGWKSSFRANDYGKHTVTLTVVGEYNKKEAETFEFNAYGYSYDKNTEEAYCLGACHDGGLTAPNLKDIYNREILRDISGAWAGTKHAQFNNAIDSAECAVCHATGFLFADINNNGNDAFPRVYGFDDLLENWFNLNDPANNKTDHLKGVTCEACHGTSTYYSGSLDSPSFISHPKSFSLSSTTCLTCHDTGKTGIHFARFYDENNKTTHENAHMPNTPEVENDPFVVRKDGCYQCHTGEGALASILGVNVSYSELKEVNGITCNVCHDPHGESGLDAQLRQAGQITLSVFSKNGLVDKNFDAKTGKLCYNCHNAQGAGLGTIPHNSQVELFNGVGGYTYDDETVNPASIHRALLTCSDCHMNNINNSTNITHVMSMHDNVNERLANCNSCHSNFGELEYTDGHYDSNGKTADVRAKMNELKLRINFLAGESDETVKPVYTIHNNQDLSDALSRAAYNYNFIIADRSFGAHNAPYAKKLLELSLTDLSRF